jgi:hydrogenase-4 component F
MPVASGLLVLAALMITGSPPFGLFFSEMTILKAGFSSSHLTATSLFLAALVVLFCGFAYQIGRIVLGPPRDPSDRRVPLPERFDLGMVTAILAAIVAIVSAFYLPASMLALIHAATQVVWGGV